MCIYVYAYMYAICTRYACGSAGTSRQRGTSTHYMHAAAWALSRRQRGGTWACLYVGGDGLPDCSALSLLGFAFESGGLSRAARVCSPAVVRPCGPVVLRSCGPAGVLCAVMLSAMHAHDLARLRTTC